jgi:hypothetical protein
MHLASLHQNNKLLLEKQQEILNKPVGVYCKLALSTKTCTGPQSYKPSFLHRTTACGAVLNRPHNCVVQPNIWPEAVRSSSTLPSPLCPDHLAHSDMNMQESLCDVNKDVASASRLL